MQLYQVQIFKETLQSTNQNKCTEDLHTGKISAQGCKCNIISRNITIEWIKTLLLEDRWTDNENTGPPETLGGLN